MLGSAIEYAETLPKNWQIEQLGNLGTFINGFSFKPTEWRNNGRPIIRIQNLNNPSRPFNYFDDEIDRRYLIVPGDILISWSASLDAFLWKNGEAWLNQHIFKALPDEDRLDRGFFFYAMKHAMLRIATHARGSTMRHVTAKQFKQSELAFPPLPEQRRIAAVLSLLQQAIEQQERLIALTTELKKALMHKLFTEGTRGEPQKQTEIGPIPESWEVVELGKYARVLNGYAFKSQDYVDSGVKLIRISNVSIGYLIDKDNKFLPESYLDEYEDYALSEGDLILSLTRPIISEGMKYCFVTREHLPAFLNQRVGKFEITDPRLRNDYLYHIVFSNYFVMPLKIMAEGSNQPNVSPARLHRFLIPVPTNIEEQIEIASLFNKLSERTEIAKRKKVALQALFRTLLHQLMTAEIRVGDLDLSELGLRTQETEINGGKNEEQACAIS